MAVAYESVGTSSNSLTCPKPSGLAVGDLMIAHLASTDSGQNLSGGHALAGWTQIATHAASIGKATALYKVADASDVAASDFTFSTPTGADTSCGAIYRLSGAAGSSGGEPTGAADDATVGPDGIATFENTITPAFANCILLFLSSRGGDTDTDEPFDGYAITNNNPTWTERYELDAGSGTSDTNTFMSGATASRPEVTATGNSSGNTISNAGPATIGIIVAVYPIVNASTSPDVVTASLGIQTPAVTGSSQASPAVISAVATINAPAVAGGTNDSLWKSQDKPSAGSITNLDKPA